MYFTTDEILGRIKKNSDLDKKVITIKITENQTLDENAEIVEDTREMKFKPITKAEFADLKTMQEIIYYQSVEPDLKDSVLLEKADCKMNPVDIVNKIFTFDEQENISDIIVRESGIFSGKKIVLMIGEDK